MARPARIIGHGPELHKYIRAVVLPSGKKSDSQVLYREFRSVQEKYFILCEECRDGELRGGPTHELFNLGGNKNIIWIDIDAPAWDLFMEWKRSPHFPFPEDSYRVIPSTSGNIHIYVVVDRAMSNWHCDRLEESLKKTMPVELARVTDRVYGQLARTTVYIPLAATGDPVLPQHLVANCSATFTVPVEMTGLSLWEQWVQHIEKKNANYSG